MFYFLFISDYYDLKFGIIPNKLSLGLFIYGLLFNVLLSILLRNSLVLIFSIVLTAFVALIAFVLWYIGFWGGGDFKIFIGLSLSLSFVDLNYLKVLSYFNFPNFQNFLSFSKFLNCFDSSHSIDLNYFLLDNARLGLDLNLPVCSQFIFYPKVFSILLNGILIAFLSLSAFLIYNAFKDGHLKYYSILSILDIQLLLNQLTTKSVVIDDLKEGMVLDKYYFDNSKVFNMINENDGFESNLNAYKEEYDYYFSSLNRIGLTKDDIDFINDLYKGNLIENPNFQIKKGIPFMPFLTLGYIGFLLFGDFISIISSFIKILF